MEVWQALREKLEQVKEDWAHGAFVGDTVDEMYAKNSAALAEVQVLSELIEFEFIEIDKPEGDESDE